jgi:hypothetical protein
MLQNARNRPKRGSGTDTPESEMDKKTCRSPASNASSPGDKNKKKVSMLDLESAEQCSAACANLYLTQSDR